MKITSLVLAFTLASCETIRADDLITTTGKTYKSARISAVESDGVTCFHAGGVVTIPFTELPEGIRKLYEPNKPLPLTENRLPPAKLPAPSKPAFWITPDTMQNELVIKYRSRDTILADQKKLAEALLYSPDAATDEKFKGGMIELKVLRRSIGLASPENFVIIVLDKDRHEILRKKGDRTATPVHVPAGWWGTDSVKLPEWSGHLTVRIVDLVQNSFCEYMITAL